MHNAKLIKPSAEYIDSYLEACREFKEIGARHHFNDPDEYHVWGPGLFDRFERFSRGEGLKEGYVPATTFWLVEDGTFIGEGSIRHTLTPTLSQYGGHIGYAIRASKWNKGYGTLQLSLLLREAARLGINQALVTCNDENIGSARVMEKNGGVHVDTIDNTIDGVQIRTRRYMIDTLPHAEGLNP